MPRLNASLGRNSRQSRDANAVPGSPHNHRATIKFDTLDGGVNKTKFISATELSREVGCSAGRILNAVETGIISPAGRAGNSKNAAVIFLRSDLDSIKSALETAGRFKAVATAPRPAHQCRDASEVLEKAAALNLARQK